MTKLIEQASYLVGGAVRDELLGRPINDEDFVVVGLTPKEMIGSGFSQVGKDFPVFLHPVTKNEYALARIERKMGVGHLGFEVYADPSVTLEEDLGRRDLTINAIAKDSQGKYCDPYGGMQDLKDRVLRHVGEAFSEDPLRVLRVARLLAELEPWGFRIHPETYAAMSKVVQSGELRSLPAERVWKETEKALKAPKPSLYFSSLRESGALAELFPEVDALFGVEQPKEHHPEIDAGVHTLLVVDQASKLSDSVAVRYAALVHDLGKALSKAPPKHHGHEKAGCSLVEVASRRLKVPSECRDLALKVTEFHLLCHRAKELTPKRVVKLFEQLDGFRRPENVEKFLLACEADARGRTGLEDRPYPQADYLRLCLEVASAVKPTELVKQGLKGPAIADGLRHMRIKAVMHKKGAELAVDRESQCSP